MDSFKTFFNKEKKRTDNLETLSLALEHQTYKQIPGTRNSYRLDSQNTNSQTQKHAHVYAKPHGKGKELYSVNIDGSGHDGFSGFEIPKRHADYFQELGFEIPSNLTLESIDCELLDSSKFDICILEDDA
ncbi:hypothetical protein QCB44_04415 [Thiomicrorhabdus sp. zzn3]|uniref:hypothetical protein n=1 Tax=Thiomicrorhabdus sp. zzn3 TaxID=3039775 RepID=UPI00243662A4|nr:hypothetical protein [Thiomicrorhabdus sp. zzn3]MDG6777947.1 hypothetical protein [Thiomicrorhabdus sp. zzn3]